jgi:hypothetical protein
MIDVTAVIDAVGSSPQWAIHWRRASAIGSMGVGVVVTDLDST